MLSKINLSFQNLVLSVIVIQILIYFTIFGPISLNYVNLNLNFCTQTLQAILILIFQV